MLVSQNTVCYMYVHDDLRWDEIMMCCDVMFLYCTCTVCVEKVLNGPSDLKVPGPGGEGLQAVKWWHLPLSMRLNITNLTTSCSPMFESLLHCTYLLMPIHAPSSFGCFTCLFHFLSRMFCYLSSVLFSVSIGLDASICSCFLCHLFLHFTHENFYS